MKKKTNKTVITDSSIGVFDKETGEIFECKEDSTVIIEETKDNETDVEDKVYDFNKGVPFVKLYLEVNKLRKYLTATEFTIALSLADYICYDDCILRKCGDKRGKILSRDDLSELMDIKKDTLDKQLRKLIKKGVIGEHKTGCKDAPNTIVTAITVNPYIYTKGCNVNETVLGLYENSRWNYE